MRGRGRPVATRPDRRRECRPDAFRQRARAQGGGPRSRGQKERDGKEAARCRKFVGGRTWRSGVPKGKGPRCPAGRKRISPQVRQTIRRAPCVGVFYGPNEIIA